MSLQTWVKPSGVEVEINDQKETIAAAKSLGWKEKGAKKPEKKKEDK